MAVHLLICICLIDVGPKIIREEPNTSSLVINMQFPFAFLANADKVLVNFFSHKVERWHWQFSKGINTNDHMHSCGWYKSFSTTLKRLFWPTRKIYIFFSPFPDSQFVFVFFFFLFAFFLSLIPTFCSLFFIDKYQFDAYKWVCKFQNQ